MDDLIKRLREPYTQDQSRRVSFENRAADRIEALECKLKVLSNENLDMRGRIEKALAFIAVERARSCTIIRRY